MFSGIVQKKAPIVRADSVPGLLTLIIDLGDLAEGLERGSSVSVSGVCLTTTTVEKGHVTFEVMGETLEKTSLGQLRVGDMVNIERSIKIGDEIGGHRVSGHVIGTANIDNIETSPNNHILTLRCNPAWMDYILPKGFIALDGCSLTVVNIGADFFTVHLIPETLRITTFGEKKVGDAINVEIDPETQAIVETVKKYLEHHAST